MDIKEVLADLNLLSTRIVSANIKNEFYSFPSKEKKETSIKLENQLLEIKKDKGVLYGGLRLTLNTKICEEETDKSLEIELTIEGMFSFNGDDEAQFEKMLLLNGNSTLYSILRADIMSISSLALPNGKITLPMINFLKLYETNQKIQRESD